MIHYFKCNMLSKSSKWELGLLYFIEKFTISRFIISRFEQWHKQNDDGCFCGRFGVLMSFLRRLKRFFLEITARRGDLTSVFQNGLEQLPRSFILVSLI